MGIELCFFNFGRRILKTAMSWDEQIFLQKVQFNIQNALFPILVVELNIFIARLCWKRRRIIKTLEIVL